MRKFSVVLVALLAAAVMVACTSAPAPAPTQAPAKPAAEPTKAAVAPAQPTTAPAQPTTAPAPKVTFPEKGKAIQVIVPWPTGGGNDVTARLLAADMEKDLGSPVQVVNKAGAGSQTGIAEGAAAKPDGYTLVNTAIPNTIGIYLDPERKATFNRKSFIPVALHTLDPITIAVNAKSPFKNLKELIDYAKANPGKLKAATGGVMGVVHLSILELQRQAGIKFTIVHFDGGAQPVTNLLGEHVDVVFDFPPGLLAHIKNNAVRPLAVLDSAPFKGYSEVPTAESLGYKIYFSTSRVFSVPANTPADVVSALNASITKVMESSDHRKKIDDMNMVLRPMKPADLVTYWENMEKSVEPLIPLAKEEQK